MDRKRYRQGAVVVVVVAGAGWSSDIAQPTTLEVIAPGANVVETVIVVVVAAALVKTSCLHRSRIIGR